jgi:pimeloyl-ACP methyl ester carboxylesterase
MFHFLADHGYRVISPSRPGYHDTPLSVGETMEAQADAFAALLDALDIRSAGIITGSGGGPASILFALRHPERCWGMVLVSAMTHPDAAKVTEGQKMLRVLFKSDLFIWCVATFLWRQLVEQGMGGLNDDIRRDPAKMEALRSVVSGLVLSSLSAKGMANDWVQWERMPIYPLEQIKVPTLIIHARNDGTMPYRIAEFTATIPGSKLVTYEDGGHTCFIAHSETTHPTTIAFLDAVRPAQP